MVVRAQPCTPRRAPRGEGAPAPHPQVNGKDHRPHTHTCERTHTHAHVPDLHTCTHAHPYARPMALQPPGTGVWGERGEKAGARPRTTAQGKERSVAGGGRGRWAAPRPPRD